jgi:peptidoglycan/LPS O-acetylase OafA/YrhL
MSSGPRLVSLDAWRGIAALWVVLFHAHEGRHISQLTAAIPGWAVTALFELGHLGVPIFFVLSGIVIAKTSAGMTAERFVLKRMIRLTPPYYFAIAFALVCLVLKSLVMPAELPSLDAISAHLLYAQDIVGYKPLNLAFWTLCIELQFYLVFAVMMAASDRFGIPMPRMLQATALIALLPLSSAPAASFLPTWHTFLLGALTYHALVGGTFDRVVYGAYLLGVALLGVTGSTFSMVAAGASVAILGCLALQLREPAWLAWLGTVSYSLYLLHNPLTGITFNVWNRIVGAGALQQLLGLALVVGVCLIAAALAYRFVEKPAIRWSQARTDVELLVGGGGKRA